MDGKTFLQLFSSFHSLKQEKKQNEENMFSVLLKQVNKQKCENIA